MPAQPQKSQEEGAKDVFYTIQKALEQKKGALIGRFGTIEFHVLLGRGSAGGGLEVLERNAGIFPITPQSIQTWRTAYERALRAADVLATGWHEPIVADEQKYLALIGWKGKQVRLRSLEPYYLVEAEDRWTNFLAGRRVCVVSSFTQTFQKQLAKGEEVIWPGAGGSIWPERSGLEETKWSFVQTGYAPVLAQGRAGWNDIYEDCDKEINSWMDAEAEVRRKVIATEAEIVLIGCGGMGMPLAGKLKEAGKICIVLGGAIQILFGVKGGRWASHPVISRFFTPEWVWPAAEETPAAATEVEGGCYWRR
jgi:hypothetical protein